MTRTDRATPRARRPRNSLNPEAIVEAALRVTDRDGVGALTFEAIGRELVAHPTAIYRHFRDKDELVKALTDRLHVEAQVDGLAVTDDWREDLRRVAFAIHRAFLAHPAIGQLVPARTAAREHEFVTVEYIVGCMRRAGLADREAALCYRVFADAVLAYSGMDAALAAPAPEARRAELLTWEVDDRRLSSGRYPQAAAIAGEFPRLDDPANFALVVDLLVEAIEARAARRMRASGRDTTPPTA